MHTKSAVWYTAASNGTLSLVSDPCRKRLGQKRVARSRDDAGRTHEPEDFRLGGPQTKVNRIVTTGNETKVWDLSILVVWLNEDCRISGTGMN